MKPKSPPVERVTLSFEQHGLREVPLVGRYVYTHAHPPLRQHIHPGVFEVCVLQHGTQTYLIGDKRFALTAGDMIITRPGEAHGTGSEPENRGRLYWVEFANPSPSRSFLGLPPGAAGKIFDSLRQLTHLQFHHCDLLIGTFERILSSDLNEMPAALVKASVQNLLMRLLLDIWSLTRRDTHHACSASVRRAMQYMVQHREESLTLARLATAAGTSESYLKVHFPREVGMTPMEHLAWLRIEKAKRLLRETSIPVTALTFQLGFVTSQHFATVFKRLTGVTPRDYRRIAGIVPKSDEQPISGRGPDFHPIAADNP